jgi:hypothetical protein
MYRCQYGRYCTDERQQVCRYCRDGELAGLKVLYIAELVALYLELKSKQYSTVGNVRTSR